MNQLGNPIESFPRGNSAAEALDYVERKIDQTIPKEERDKYISSMRHDSIGVRISLASSSFFNTGSVKLRTQSLDSLNKVAEILKQTDKKVIIEGHTDDTPVADGSAFESNWELASLRATTVVRYLERVHGISPKRMAAISYADQKPIVPNTSEENRNKNRRIEILIVMDEKN